MTDSPIAQRIGDVIHRHRKAHGLTRFNGRRCR
jgi:hypothetical protein